MKSAALDTAGGGPRRPGRWHPVAARAAALGAAAAVATLVYALRQSPALEDLYVVDTLPLLVIVGVWLAAWALSRLRWRQPLGGFPDILQSALYYGGGLLLSATLGLAAHALVVAGLRARLFATPFEGLSGGLALLAAGVLLAALLAVLFALPRVCARAQLAGRMSAMAVRESLAFVGIAGVLTFVMACRLSVAGDFVYLAGAVLPPLAVFVAVRLWLSAPRVVTPTPLLIVLPESVNSPLVLRRVGRFAGCWEHGPVTFLAPRSQARVLAGAHAGVAQRAGSLAGLFPDSQIELEEARELLPAEGDWRALPVRECYPADALWAESARLLLTPHAWVVVVAESHAQSQTAGQRLDALRGVLPPARSVALCDDFIPPLLHGRHLAELHGRLSGTAPAKLAEELYRRVKPRATRRILVAHVARDRGAARMLTGFLDQHRDRDGRLVEARMLPLTGGRMFLWLHMLPWEILSTVVRSLFTTDDGLLWRAIFGRMLRVLLVGGGRQCDLVLLRSGQAWTASEEHAAASLAPAARLKVFDRVIIVAIDTASREVRAFAQATHYAGAMGMTISRPGTHVGVADMAQRILALDVESIQTDAASSVPASTAGDSAPGTPASEAAFAEPAAAKTASASASPDAAAEAAPAPIRARSPARPGTPRGLWRFAAFTATVVVAGIVWTLAARVSTPQLIGLDEKQARAALSERGLAPGNIVAVETGTAPAGSVTAQDPAPGTRLAKGSAVDLSIAASAGKSTAPPRNMTQSAVPPPSVSMPDLLGLTIEEARSLLTKAGIPLPGMPRPHLAVRNVPGAREGEVVSQQPPPGTGLTADTRITIGYAEYGQQQQQKQQKQRGSAAD